MAACLRSAGLGRFGWERCWYDRTIAGLNINRYPGVQAITASSHGEEEEEEEEEVIACG